MVLSPLPAEEHRRIGDAEACVAVHSTSVLMGGMYPSDGSGRRLEIIWVQTM